MLRSAALFALVVLASCVPQRRGGGDETPSCPAVRQCANDVCCDSGQKCDEAGSACVACVATTCEAEGWSCGVLEDGCGGTASCGSCQAGFECGDAHACLPATCKPKTCASAGANCGTIADGCGSRISCGNCTSGTCGGGGGPNRCGTGTCTPENDLGMCARLGVQCGELVDFDNCGNSRSVASCGRCDEGSLCNDAGRCVCTGESDATLCADHPDACGTVRLPDSCGVTRTVTCRGCGLPGDPCASNEECRTTLFCLSEQAVSVPGGMCSKLCSESDLCSEGSVCASFESVSFCAARCTTTAECREGFTCQNEACLPANAG